MKRYFVAGVYDASGPDDKPEHSPWGAPRGCVVRASTASAAAAKVLYQLHRDAGLTLVPTTRVVTAHTEDHCRLVGPLGDGWVYVATAPISKARAREYERLRGLLSRGGLN